MTSVAQLGFAVDSSQALSAASNLDKMTAAALKTDQAAAKLASGTDSLTSSLAKSASEAQKTTAPVEKMGRAMMDQDEHVRAFRMEIERLTMKYQPLARATASYEASVREIQTAHRLGIISSSQMTANLDKERQAFDRLKASASAANAVMTPANQNAAANGSGIQQARMAAMQLSQVAQQTQATGNFIQSLAIQLPDLALGFGPIGIAAGVAAGAALTYFANIQDNGPKAAEELKKQADLIRGIAQSWGEGIPAIERYASELERARMAAEAAEAGRMTRDKIVADTSAAMADLNFMAADLSSKLMAAGAGNDVINGLSSTFQKLKGDVEQGKATQEDFNAAISAARDASSTGISGLDGYISKIESLRTAALDAAKETDGLNRAITAAQNKALNNPANWRSSDPLFSIGNPDGPIKGGDFEQTPLFGPTPESRPLIELDGLPGSQKGTNKDFETFKRSMEAAKDNVAQLRLQAQTAGEAGIAADTLRFKLDLLQRAFKDGAEATPKQREEIDALAESYRQAAQAASDAKFASDFAFSVRQAARTPGEQSIASQLRSSGRPDDLSSGQAGQLRQLMQWQDAKDMAKGFSSAFKSEFVSGSHDIGKAFLKGFKATLESQMDKAWEGLFDKLGTSFANWLVGAPGAGSAGQAAAASGAGIIGKIIGAPANDNTGTAPVGAVTRAALPSVAASGDIASYITNAAVKRGIDPDIALRVAKSEGGLNSWNLQSNYVKNGVREPSFGPFQLYKGGGLGNEFMRKTGMDPALASSGPAGVDFALDHAAKNGWGAWYGAGKAGIGNWQGIGSGSGTEPVASAFDKLTTKVNTAADGLGQFDAGIGGVTQKLLGGIQGPASPGIPVPSLGGLGAAAGNGQLSNTFGFLGALGSGIGQFFSAIPAFFGFAGGTGFAPGGWSVVGERGPELLNLPQGAGVMSNHKLMEAVAANNAPSRSTSDVRVSVDNNGNLQAYVSKVSQEKAAAVSGKHLSDYDTKQRRGGIGEQMRRHSNQKV
ncbi:hypothetical protein BTR14_13115 [Rhizobium rhizosphaerae]|uniref:Bacteriophage tail tape measure N-terminal domain-containing protein n=1 Tax=Xaviernesmea rhizosphaerae TaxID=1672749 RepID=A0ABX3PD90_9HYPH|nr:hypothetical protein [Xaviernesmea rhizosphaerae]OQP86017.1 hypothetical protein BTR14_13115 [Xaviernesmea rhizosphaerae]